MLRHLWSALVGFVRGDRTVKPPSPQAIVIIEHPHPVHALAFSPDGQDLAAGDHESDPTFYAVINGRQPRWCHRRDAEKPHSGALAYNRKGIIASAIHPRQSARAPYVLWHPTRERITLGPKAEHPEFRQVNGLSFSPDGKRIAVTAGCCWSVWLAHEGRCIYRTPAQGIKCAIWHPSAPFIAVAGDNGGPALFNADSGDSAYTFMCMEPASHLAFSADGTQLATTHKDGMLRVWRAGSSRPRHMIRVAPADNALCMRVAFCPSGLRAAVGCSDGKVRIADPARGKITHVLEGLVFPVYALAWHGELVAAGGEEKKICVWNIPMS
jgi:WD40 repeat protein